MYQQYLIVFLFLFYSLVFCLITTFYGSSTSTNIECYYKVLNSNFFKGNIFHCLLNNNPNILTKESAQINSINETHQGSKINDDVEGFYAESKTIQFFPKGLDKIFKNLKVIEIKSCGLKEIHQSDLKVFPNLVYLFLQHNEIKVIEAGLFDYNPNLDYLGFEERKIIYIDPNVFDNLNKLNGVWLGNVPCIYRSEFGERSKVQELIKVVKSKCSSSEFLVNSSARTITLTSILPLILHLLPIF